MERLKEGRVTGWRPRDLGGCRGVVMYALLDTSYLGTGLLSHETGGWCHPFSRVDIDVDHKKRVDLGVLRGADHDGLGEQAPFQMVSVDREGKVFNTP